MTDFNPDIEFADLVLDMAEAGRDAATRRIDVLIPLMEKHGFTYAGEALDYLHAQDPTTLTLDEAWLLVTTPY